MTAMGALRHFFTNYLGVHYYIALYGPLSIQEALLLAPRDYALALVNFDARPLRPDDPLFEGIGQMPLPDDEYVDHLRACVIGEDCERIHDLIDSAIIARAAAAEKDPWFSTSFWRFDPTEDRRQFEPCISLAVGGGKGACILVRDGTYHLGEVAAGVVQYCLEHEFAPADWRYSEAELEEMQAAGLEPEPPPVLRRFFVAQDGTMYYIGLYGVASAARVLSDPGRYALKVVNCEPYRLPDQDWLTRAIGERLRRSQQVPPMLVSGRLAARIAEGMERALREYCGARAGIDRYDCVDLREVAHRCAEPVAGRDQAILVCGDHQELGLVAGEVVGVLLRKEFATRSEPV